MFKHSFLCLSSVHFFSACNIKLLKWYVCYLVVVFVIVNVCCFVVVSACFARRFRFSSLVKVDWSFMYVLLQKVQSSFDSHVHAAYVQTHSFNTTSKQVAKHQKQEKY